jgi:O-antigen/teichoic acid export membrane protein
VLSDRKTRRRFVGYGAARVVVEGLVSVRGIALAAILGVEGFGVWLLFRIFLRYAGFAGLGLARGLEYGAASKRGNKPASVWGSAAIALSLAVFLPLSGLCVSAGLMLSPGPAATALIGVGIVILANRLWTLGLAYLRAIGGLRDLAFLEILMGVLQVLVVVGLALFFGLPGAFAGVLTSLVIGSALLFRKYPLPPRWNVKLSMQMIRVGFPVTLSSLLLASFTLSDRLVVGAFLGSEALGLYGLAIAASELGQNVANVARTVILPEIYGGARTVAERKDSGRLASILTGFAIFVPALSGFFALALGPAIATFLPAYAAASGIVQIYLFVAALHGLSILATLGVVARLRQSVLPLVSLIGVALSVAITVTLVMSGAGLQGIALAALTVHGLHATAIVSMALTGRIGRDGIVIAARIILPVLWCLVAVNGVLWWLDPKTPLAIVQASTVYALVISPLVLMARAGSKERRMTETIGKG